MCHSQYYLVGTVIHIPSVSSQMCVCLYIYWVGHEKVARLPFCTCPCDILSGVSTSVWTVSQRSCCHHFFPPRRWSSTIARCWLVLISVFTLCYGPGLLFRGPFCIYAYVYIHTHTIFFTVQRLRSGKRIKNSENSECRVRKKTFHLPFLVRVP